jgi:muramoyltetrapeptide carboxypeptidase
MSVFRPLKAGEPIGVVALSGPIDPERLEVGLAALRSWGHPVELAANLDRRAGYLAGSDDERLEGLAGLLDRGVRCLIGARGGFGVTRLLGRLPWRRLSEVEACFVGFSDLTAVLNPLAERFTQVHGPMVSAGLARPGNARRLLEVLEGSLHGKRLFRFGPDRVVRAGRAGGPAAGGNLTVLAALAGTPFAPDLRGRVLFLEEVAEPPYRLDRLLTQISCSASFDGVKALISGTLYGCRPRGECVKTWRDRLLELAPPGVPVVVGLPFGHGATNMAFPVGATVTVDTEQGSVEWSG